MHEFIKFLNESLFKSMPFSKVSDNYYESANNYFSVKLNDVEVEIFLYNDNVYYGRIDEFNPSHIMRSILRRCNNNLKYNSKAAIVYKIIIEELTHETLYVPYIIKLLNESICKKSPIIYDNEYYSVSEDLQYALYRDDNKLGFNYKGEIIYVIEDDQNVNTLINDIKSAMIIYFDKRVKHYENMINDVKALRSSME